MNNKKSVVPKMDMKKGCVLLINNLQLKNSKEG